MTTTIDDRGRVLIPKELRAQAGIEAGQEVRVEIDEGGNLAIQPVLPADEFLEAMGGAIDEDTRREGAEPIDPLELKRMWEPSP
jgi:AbrB family looped-hinge helix DNA binding protein